MSDKSVRSAARALIMREGRILVVRHVIKDDTHFLLPGGGQNHGEPLHETLRRECFEETGCAVEVGELLCLREFIEANHPYSFPSDYGDLHAVEHIFRCELKMDQEPDIATRGDRTQAGLDWFSIAELREQPFHPMDVLDLLEGACDGPAYLGDVN